MGIQYCTGAGVCQVRGIGLALARHPVPTQFVASFMRFVAR
jgi:hypothetical protein